METAARKECVNEAKLLQSIPDHAHLIKYVESFLHQNELFLVLEFAERGDFSQLLASARAMGRPLVEGDIWRFAFQISSALAHMHSVRVMHRDIKPV